MVSVVASDEPKILASLTEGRFFADGIDHPYLNNLTVNLLSSAYKGKTTYTLLPNLTIHLIRRVENTIVFDGLVFVSNRLMTASIKFTKKEELPTFIKALKDDQQEELFFCIYACLISGNIKLPYPQYVCVEKPDGNYSKCH